MNILGDILDEATGREIVLDAGHTSDPQLKKAIQDYLDAHKDNPKPFKWTKSADPILESIARFAQRTLDTHDEPDFA